MQNFLREAKIEVKGLDILDLGLQRADSPIASFRKERFGHLRRRGDTDNFTINSVPTPGYEPRETNLRHLTAKSLPNLCSNLS